MSAPAVNNSTTLNPSTFKEFEIDDPTARKISHLVNSTDGRGGRTALMESLQNSHTVRVLIALRADVNLGTERQTPVETAICWVSEALPLLIEAKADLTRYNSQPLFGHAFSAYKQYENTNHDLKKIAKDNLMALLKAGCDPWKKELYSGIKDGKWHKFAFHLTAFEQAKEQEVKNFLDIVKQATKEKVTEVFKLMDPANKQPIQTELGVMGGNSTNSLMEMITDYAFSED
jgi:hypothetical protein